MKIKQKTQTRQTGAAKAIEDIRRATRKQYSAEEKIRIVLDGLRGEATIAELCRIEGIAQSIYYKWSKEFMEAGKRRLAGDTSRAARTAARVRFKCDVMLSTNWNTKFQNLNAPTSLSSWRPRYWWRKCSASPTP